MNVKNYPLMLFFQTDTSIPAILLTREISFCLSTNQMLGNLSRQNMAL